MSNFVGFLEKIGADGSLRHAEPAQVEQAMKQHGADVDALLGTTETMYCATFMVKPPKKQPGKRRGSRPQPAVRH